MTSDCAGSLPEACTRFRGSGRWQDRGVGQRQRAAAAQGLLLIKGFLGFRSGPDSYLSNKQITNHLYGVS